jgi:hypothetical protein
MALSEVVTAAVLGEVAVGGVVVTTIAIVVGVMVVGVSDDVVVVD